MSLFCLITKNRCECVRTPVDYNWQKLIFARNHYTKKSRIRILNILSYMSSGIWNFYYFSKVSVRLRIIKHGQAVHVKRRRHFLGVLFVLAGWLEVLQVSSDTQSYNVFSALSIKDIVLLLYMP